MAKGTFTAKEFNGEFREYTRAEVQAQRLKSTGEIWFFLWARRASLHREVWDLIDASQDAGAMVDMAERLNGQRGKDEDERE